MAVDLEYVSTLVQFGKSSDANLALLTARQQELFNSINVAEGRDLVSFSMAGQSIHFSRQGLTTQDELGAVTQALAILAGKPYLIRSYYPTFW
jgi:hypothetical protein